jgi:copper(I)-binding protein
MKKKLAPLSILAMSALLLASCGDDDVSTDSTNSEVPAVDVTSNGSDSELVIDISAVWARTSPAMTSLGAVYMNIDSSIDDELLSASVDVSIAGSAEVHETMTAPMHSDSMPMNGMSGEMSMREVSAVMIPAGETVQFMPGGYHIMLIGLVTPLELGQTFEVTLTFANAGQVVVIAEVRDDAP